MTVASDLSYDSRLAELLKTTTVLDDYRAQIGDDYILADTLAQPRQNNEPPIVIPLHNALYQRFYCHLPDADSLELSESENTNPDEFLARLRAANQGREQLSPEWAIHSDSLKGQAIVFSGEVVHIAELADLVPQQGADGKSTGWTSIRFAVERLSPETGFYFAMGETPADAFDRTLVTRLYFNLDPAGAVLWIGLITSLFNRSQVPFTLKCPLQPRAFRRSDSCVLYIARRDVPIVSQLLEQLYSQLRGILRSTTPMFTGSLEAGIGLADDPGNGQSFGQHRMLLVARALAKAATNQAATLELKWQAIVNEFSLNGLSINSPYLNAAATPIDVRIRGGAQSS